MDFAFLAQTNNFILKPIAWFFSLIINLIYNGVSQITTINALGLTIILFTLITRVLLFPLSLKQQRSTRMMQRLQPKQQRIQDKYKDKKNDPEAQRMMQMELSALYKENKTSPMAGCLPMLIQMPILFALYEILRNTSFYITSYGEFFDNMTNTVLQMGSAAYAPLAETFSAITKTISKFDISAAAEPAVLFDSMKELLSHFTQTDWNTFFGLDSLKVLAGNAEFAGAVDMTQKLNSFIGFNLTEVPGFAFPIILWPIAAGFTTWLQSWLMQKSNDKRTIAAGGDPKSSANSTTKTMNLIMPFFMAFIMLSVPLGLGLYWTIGNVFGILQQFLLDWMIDQEDYKKALSHQKELEEKRRLKELARSNIDQKTGKRVGTADYNAMRSAMAGNRKAASMKRAEVRVADNQNNIVEEAPAIETTARDE